MVDGRGGRGTPYLIMQLTWAVSGWRYGLDMPRLARVVVPGVPHHVTQRGNRRQQTFFCDDDYEAYLALMAEWRGRRGQVVNLRFFPRAAVQQKIDSYDLSPISLPIS